MCFAMLLPFSVFSCAAESVVVHCVGAAVVDGVGGGGGAGGGGLFRRQQPMRCC